MNVRLGGGTECGRRTVAPDPSGVHGDEYGFVAPHLAGFTDHALHRSHPLRAGFDALRWLVRTALHQYLKIRTRYSRGCLRPAHRPAPQQRAGGRRKVRLSALFLAMRGSTRASCETGYREFSWLSSRAPARASVQASPARCGACEAYTYDVAVATFRSRVRRRRTLPVSELLRLRLTLLPGGICARSPPAAGVARTCALTLPTRLDQCSGSDQCRVARRGRSPG
jgi:hypothetical protein